MGSLTRRAVHGGERCSVLWGWVAQACARLRAVCAGVRAGWVPLVVSFVPVCVRAQCGALHGTLLRCGQQTARLETRTKESTVLSSILLARHNA